MLRPYLPPARVPLRGQPRSPHWTATPTLMRRLRKHSARSRGMRPRHRSHRGCSCCVPECRIQVRLGPGSHSFGSIGCGRASSGAPRAPAESAELSLSARASRVSPAGAVKARRDTLPRVQGSGGGYNLLPGGPVQGATCRQSRTPASGLANPIGRRANRRSGPRTPWSSPPRHWASSR